MSLQWLVLVVQMHLLTFPLLFQQRMLFKMTCATSAKTVTQQGMSCASTMRCCATASLRPAIPVPGLGAIPGFETQSSPRCHNIVALSSNLQTQSSQRRPVHGLVQLAHWGGCAQRACVDRNFRIHYCTSSSHCRYDCGARAPDLYTIFHLWQTEAKSNPAVARASTVG